MKIGIRLITEERQEQIDKHGWTLQHDKEVNKNKELSKAAHYILMLCDFPRYKGLNLFWPENWYQEFHNNILNKTHVGKLIVAGALLMAENDRRHDRFYEDSIKEIAAEIDRLQNQL